MECNRTKIVFALVLVLVSVIALVPPEAISQSYSTITTQVTRTSMTAYPTFTQYVTTAESSFVYGPTGFNLNICGLGAHQMWTLNAIRGQPYHVAWTVQGSISLDLYITPTFAGANNVGCNNFPDNLALSARSGAVGSVDWTAPSTGQFIVWLWDFTGNPASGTISIATSPTTTFTYVSWTTQIAYVTNPTLIISTVSVSLALFPDLGPLAHNQLLIEIFILALALVFVGVLLFRRRKNRSGTRVYDHVVTVPVSRVDENAPAREATLTFARAKIDEADHEVVEGPATAIFCPECGTENLNDSRFCRKCGIRLE